MKKSIKELLKELNSLPPESWPRNNRYAMAMTHGSMYVELYAPVKQDMQSPHKQDELYIVKSGSGLIIIGEKTIVSKPVTCSLFPHTRSIDLLISRMISPRG